MKNMDIRMGTLPQPFNDGKAQSITFCVTEECNLRCKYCYMTEKNSYHRMTLDTAKKAGDYFLKQEPTDPAVSLLAENLPLRWNQLIKYLIT